MCSQIFGLGKDFTLKTNTIPYEECYNNDSVFAHSDLILVWLNFESLLNVNHNSLNNIDQFSQDIITIAMQISAYIRSISNAHMMWMLFEDYFLQLRNVTGSVPIHNLLVEKLNIQILGMQIDDCSFIDLKYLITCVGIKNAFSMKNKYRWNSPYSKDLTAEIVKSIYKQLLIHYGISRKCLVLDCDNVLWGGTISEDGIDGICLDRFGLGRRYYEFQSFVLTLHKMGIILAVCSKNDRSDVLSVFQSHSGMVLQKNHISCFMVNWLDKPHNIIQIANQLNIGLDSIVFVDDQQIEVNAVNDLLPEVKTILFQNDFDYSEFDCFNLSSLDSNATALARTKTYQTDAARKALLSSSHSYTDYINALNVTVDIHRCTPYEFARVAELSQRTNRCTNGTRYTISNLKNYYSFHNTILYVVQASDRFADLGIIGAIGLHENTIDLICISCRALGRNIENNILDFVSQHHHINSIQFYDTGKNEDFLALLKGHFNPITIV